MVPERGGPLPTPRRDGRTRQTLTQGAGHAKAQPERRWEQWANAGLGGKAGQNIRGAEGGFGGSPGGSQNC